MTKRDGHRLSVWIPKADEWMLRTMDRLRKSAEEAGIPVTEGELVRLALEEYLLPKASDGDVAEYESKSKTPPAPKGNKRMIVFRKEFAEVLAKLDRIVQMKTLSGISTSFSYEVVRLVRNALTRTVTGSDLDRSILSDSSADKP
jgi:hypothetical protein